MHMVSFVLPVTCKMEYETFIYSGGETYVEFSSVAQFSDRAQIGKTMPTAEFLLFFPC